MSDPVDPSQLGQQYILFTGPLVVALILDWCLQGTLIVQLYLYYNANRKDPTTLKLVVYIVFLLDVIQTVFATSHTWNMVVVNWGNPDIVPHPFWAGGVLPMLSGMISGLVQSFFAWRIYTLKPTRLVLAVSCLIVAIALIQCISSIIESAQFIMDTSNLDRIFVKHYIWLSGTLVADLIITGSMVAVLWDVRTSSHFESTDRMIMRLIILTIEVGAVTTVVAGVEVAISKLYPNALLFEVPAYILGKLSNNSLLVSLNARGYIRGGARSQTGTASTSTSTTLDVIKLNGVRDRGLSDTQLESSRQAAIHITTDTVTDHDAYLDHKAAQNRV